MENGTYRAKAVRAELGETNTGNVQVGIAFQLTAEEYSGQKLTWYGTFTDKAMPITLKALRTAGWKGEDVSDLSSIGGPDAPEVDLVVENEEYQGQWRTKVKWVNAAGGPMMKTALTGDKAKAFAAKMRGAVLAFDKAAGATKAAPSPRGGVLSPEPPPPSEGFEDIPF